MCTAQVSWPSGPAAGAAPGQASRQRSDARTMSAVGAKARRAMRASFGIEGIQDRNGGPIIPTARPLSTTSMGGAGPGAVGGGQRREVAVIERGQLTAAPQHQLLEDVSQVRLDRCLADVEPAGHFLVAQPAGDELGDVLLATAEPV